MKLDWERRLNELRDEIIEELSGFGAHSRELSLALARLDEARAWYREHGIRTGTHLIIDTREYADNLKETINATPRKQVRQGDVVLSNSNRDNDRNSS